MGGLTTGDWCDVSGGRHGRPRGPTGGRPVSVIFARGFLRGAHPLAPIFCPGGHFGGGWGHPPPPPQTLFSPKTFIEPKKQREGGGGGGAGLPFAFNSIKTEKLPAGNRSQTAKRIRGGKKKNHFSIPQKNQGGLLGGARGRSPQCCPRRPQGSGGGGPVFTGGGGNPGGGGISCQSPPGGGGRRGALPLNGTRPEKKNKTGVLMGGPAKSQKKKRGNLSGGGAKKTQKQTQTKFRKGGSQFHPGKFFGVSVKAKAG